MKFVFIKILLPIAVLFVGIAAAGYLVKTRPQAPRIDRPTHGPLVNVQRAVVGDKSVTVKAIGKVGPARRVVLQPEVTGRVVAHADALVDGGLLVAGEVAVKIDDTDYALAVRQQSAQVTRARLDIRLETGRQAVAEKEWALLDNDVAATVDGKSLALRKPQLAAARASVSAARSLLARAKLMVDKTEISVPFNAFVQRESVEIGMLASPATQLATLVGTDAFWIEATVSVNKLGWIDVPGQGGFEGQVGSAVRIIQDAGDAVEIVRQGRVVRLLGELDPMGVQARVIVEIKDPLLLGAPGTGLPVLLNSFVTLEIVGRELKEAVEVPRVAIRGGDSVWIMDAEDKLVIRPITIAWRDADSVFVTSGIAPGERIITTRLSRVVEGMLLREEGADVTVAPPGSDGKRSRAVAASPNAAGAQ